jgi:hypothetical protein
MNLQAAVKGIAPAGGIRPASHITASPVSATKAEPAAQFGGVPPRSPYGVQGAARCGLIPRLHLATVIEGTTNRTVPAAHDAYGCVSDLSRSSIFPANASACMRNMDLNQQVSPIGRYGNADVTLSGQRSNTDERHIGRQRFGLSRRTVGATSRSGGIHGLSACMELKSMPHWSRNLGNPCAEKVRPHRPRQSSAPEGHRQGTLTITGSNVHRGTEMPVALSLFL